MDREADLTILVHPNDHPQDSDLVEPDANDWVTAIRACPHAPGQCFDNLVNGAVYVVRREALRPWSAFSGQQDFTKNIMAGLLANGGRVLACRSSEYLKHIGTPSRLQSAQEDWRAGRIRLQNSGSGQPAVFLDRDGTLCVEKGHLRTPEDLELLPAVGSTLRTLRQAGFRLVVLTNQPVTARGEATEREVAAIHRRLAWEIGKEGAYLDAIYICPHHPDRGFPGERVELKTHCECRKPGTKLFEQACRDLGIDAAQSRMIGDRSGDIEMARRAGLRSVMAQTARRDAMCSLRLLPITSRMISQPLQPSFCKAGKPRPCDHFPDPVACEFSGRRFRPAVALPEKWTRCRLSCHRSVGVCDLEP